MNHFKRILTGLSVALLLAPLGAVAGPAEDGQKLYREYCRGCHDYDTMNLDDQGRTARKKHKRAQEEGETCIECHKGVAHEEPDEPENSAQTGERQARG